MPARKETEHLSFNYYRGVDWYIYFLGDIPAGHIGFDISPIYFMDRRSDEENARLAEEVFSEDVAFYYDLFKNSKIILGNGEPFGYS